MLLYLSLVFLVGFPVLVLSLKEYLDLGRVHLDSNLPGPPSLPFIGNLWTVIQLKFRPAYISDQLRHKYGDFARIWLGSWPVIFINSPKAAYHLLQQQASISSSRPLHNNWRHSSLPNRIVVESTGPKLQYLRKLYHEILQRHSSNFRRNADEESLFLLRTLAQNPSQFLFACEKFALNVIFKELYSCRIEQEQDHLIKEIYDIWATMYLYFLPWTCPFDVFPILLRLPTWMQPWEWLVQKLKMRELAFHRPFLRSTRSAQLEFHSSNTFVGFLVQKEKEGELDDEAILNITTMLLGAGSDTTSAVLQVFFKVIALHPEAALIAQEELDKVVGSERLPTWDDADKLQYIHALISEMHRWAPIAIIGIPHATTKEIVYQNCTIAKGTILVPNIVGLSRHEDQYIDPNKFDPSRFLTRAYKNASKSSYEYKERQHFAFGFGRRFCPGSHIAEDSLFISIARILWVFDIRHIPGSRLNMKQQRDGLLRKPLPFRVSIIPRSPERLNLIK